MKKKVFALSLIILFLYSCNSVRESAGVNRKVIDEYSVIENPPLIIPPDISLLPPEQIKTKNIEDFDTELAKEILFGLDDNETIVKEDVTLMDEIIDQTQANEVSDDVRNIINEEFAGEKSSIEDEEKFSDQTEVNSAIEETKLKNNTKINTNKSKDGKKKRFFFFNKKDENNEGENNETKKKKRFFFF